MEDGSQEHAVRAACEAGAFDEATERALRMYGGEVYGFLVGVHRDRDDADDAFSRFAERLWSNMATFAWRCSLRTWIYLLARSASSEIRREAAREEARRYRPNAQDPLSQVAAQVRTETISFLRTEKRTALEELQRSLDEDERELLILRAARELSWRDVALIVGETDERDLELEARLRKRYQLLKAKLRQLGRSKGLL